MDTITLVLLIIVIAVIAVAVWAFTQRAKLRKVRTRYGPEYERLVEKERDPIRAANILEKREKRVAAYKIRTLTQDECDSVSNEWRLVQEHFVDDPYAAVTQADALVNRSLQLRGYPMGDFERQADDLSVDHPHVVENFRAAHSIAQRRDSASTEDLRRAMQHYRDLLENIIDAHVMQTGRRL